jgi:hypothetical protein
MTPLREPSGDSGTDYEIRLLQCEGNEDSVGRLLDETRERRTANFVVCPRIPIN